MVASPNFVLLENELEEFSGHIDSAAKTVDGVKDILGNVKDILEIPKDISKASDELKKAADAGGAIAKVLAKVGFLKPIALPFKDVMYEVSDTFKKIEEKSKKLEKQFKPYIEKIEKAEKVLTVTKFKLVEAADDVGDLSEEFGYVNDRLNGAEIFVLSSVEAPEIKARLRELFSQIDTVSGVASAALVPPNDLMEKVEDAADALRNLIDIPDFQGLIDFTKLLKSIQDSLAFLTEPLEAVYDAAGAVLDALGSIFGFILKPLEAILDAVIEATGIQDLLDEATAFIVSLLPDVTILDDIAQALRDALEIDFDFQLNLGIQARLDELLAALDPAQFLPSVIGPVTDASTITGHDGNDIHLGLLNRDGGEFVRPTTGDDLIVGGRFDDTLNGGDGVDYIIGGGGDDTIDGGGGFSKDPNRDRDVVIYSGNSGDYSIVSELGDDGLNTGVWYVSDYSFDSPTPDGYDKLINVEDIVFLDKTIPIGDLDTYIRTRSLDGSYGDYPANGQPGENDGVYGYFISAVREGSTAHYSDVREISGIKPGMEDDEGNEKYIKEGPLLYTSSGVDWVYTGPGFEEIYAGPGPDQLSSYKNGPISDAMGYPGDVLFGEEGDDIFLIGAGSGIYDFVSGGDGTDSAVYQKMEFGLSIFMGTGEDYDRFKPTSIPIQIDFKGTPQSDPNLPVLGVITGVENINVTEFDDHVWGSEVGNVILGGGGNDQIRGLGGNDIIRGGAGSDTLIGDRGDDLLDGGSGPTVFVGGLGNDTMEAEAKTGGFNTLIYDVSPNLTSFYQSGFVDFETTGYFGLDLPSSIAMYDSATRGRNWVSKYDGNGEFIGQDEVYNIDVLVGSGGDDIIYGAAGLSQILHGSDGNDYLEAGDGTPTENDVSTGSRLYGGFGNDTLVSNVGPDLLTGNEGSDTFRVIGDQNIDRDVFNGDHSLNAVLEGTDVFDISQSNYSWNIYLRAGAGAGNAIGKFALTIADAEDHKYIQPTAGINGVVPRDPNNQLPGEREGVNFELRVPDANTPEPGGQANISRMEVINGSQQRDIIVVGSPNSAMTAFGNGGDDVLYSSQIFSDSLFGGDGNDVLGSFNQSTGTDNFVRNFDESVVILLDGADGDDTFVAGDAREIFLGGFGTDEVTYETGPGGVTVDLETGLASGGYAEGDRLVSIENLTGSADSDVLTGNNDSNILLGWSGDDTLSGNFGEDLLFGNSGDDVLSGGEGNDQLHGGLGNDTLDGGDGIDTAIYSELQIHPKGGTARLIGEPAGVEVDLEARTGADDTLWNIENIIGSLAGDTLSGDGGDNVLGGEDGDDILDGRAGADVLDGGDGDDTLRGGEGDDWFNGGAGTNVIEGGDGFDTLDYGSLEYGLVIEMAGVGARADESSGLVSKQVEQPWVVWSDSVTEIADPLGAPGDTIESGTEEVRYTQQRFDQGTDDPSDDTFRDEDPITPERLFRLNPTFARHPDDLEDVRFLPDDDLLAEQEFSLLSRYEAATDAFSGIELLSGGSGDDSILGNAENTEFHGGGGADSINGGEGIDTANYKGSEAAVQVNLETRTAAGGDADGDVLSEIENLTGSDYGDMLTGDLQDNELRGGGGSDTLRGGAGTDTAVFGYASTEAVFGFADDGIKIIRTSGMDILEIDLAALDIEQFRFADVTYTSAQLRGEAVQGDETDNTLIGTQIADLIPGFAGNDRIEGRASNDTLLGGLGNDTLLGEEGNDSLGGGAGSDSMLGGPGDDIYIVDDAGDEVIEARGEGIDRVISTVSHTLSRNVENLILTGTAIEAIGNGLNNRLTGNESDNVFDGGSGIDTVIFATRFSDAVFDFSRVDYFTVTTTAGIDRLSDIEFLEFDGSRHEVSDLKIGQSPSDGVRLNASSYFENDFAIDNSPEGGGAQFLYIGEASQGQNDGNRFHFATAFEDNGGHAVYQGSGFLQPATAFVNSLRVDFEGGNTQDVSIDGMNLPFRDFFVAAGPEEGAEPTVADWEYFQTRVFGGNDQMIGSYYGDHLVGYTGNDTIMGGRGDKEKYDILANRRPDPTPTPFRKAGEATDNPDFWVDDGDDTLEGNAGDDLIDGGTGNDLLMGGSGDDQIWGGGDLGNDTMDGGSGSDTMRGGGGVDEVVYTRFASTEVSVAAASEGGLKISSAEGVDYVDDTVENYRFTDGLFTAAQIAELIVSGDTGPDTLIGTANSDTINGGGGADRIEGRAGPDSLSGGDGNDTLLGESGDDTMDGGAGTDSMIGGPGDDIYLVDDASESIVEDLNAGQDSVRTDVSFVLPDNVEDLMLGGSANLSGTGNELANLIDGNDGQNTLVGHGQDDTLLGGSSSDSLVGGAGDDSLVGGGAVDILEGDGGDDHLDGGAGSDRMDGGLGDDVFMVDDAADVTIESEDEGTDEVRSTITFGLQANIENLTLVGDNDATATGNDLANILRGDGSDNVLNGLLGDDSHFGDTGTDTVGIDKHTDLVAVSKGMGGIYVGSTEGVDFIADDVEWVQFRDVMLTPEQALALTANRAGTRFDDILIGTPLADRFATGTGDDRVEARAGNDIVEGQQGDDILLGEAGDDTLLGGEGADDLSGGDGDDKLQGGTENDRLSGGAGNDTLVGESGIDTATGGSGDDLYSVDDSADEVIETEDGGQDTVEASTSYTLPDHVEELVLTGSGNADAMGNASANILVGNAFDNRLTGGAGDDTAVGGAGADTYVFDLLQADVRVTEVTREGLRVTSTEGEDFLSADIESFAFNDGVLSYDELALLTKAPEVRTAYTFVLDGAQVETAVTTTAAGVGFGLYDPDSQSFAYTLRVSGLDWGNIFDANVQETPEDGDNVTTAHIHIGARGDSGGVAFAMLDDSPSQVHNADGSRTISGVWDASDANPITPFAEALGSTAPGDDVALYFNIHTARNGGGEIRGQIVSSADDQANTVTGNPEISDTLFGLDGNDTLLGDSGNDELRGESGEDSLVGAAGNDALFGGDQDDVLEGGAGNDRLDGGGGADALSGGAGDDVYLVDDADTVTEAANGGTDTVIARLTNSAYTMPDHVETLQVLANGGSLDIRDNALGNTIDGGADVSADGSVAIFAESGGDDVLGNAHFIFAGDGDDTITGGTSNLTQLHGDGGRDDITGRSGNEQIFGGAGADTVSGGAGNDLIWGSSTDVSVAEDGADDSLSGNGGNDTIFGGKAPDASDFDPLALDGDDVLDGGAGNDSLVGGTGNDTLLGGAGADRLVGGAGNDDLDGGADADTAVFGVARSATSVELVGNDLVLSSAEGNDTVSSTVETLIFSDGTISWADLRATLVVPGVGRKGTDGPDTLIGTPGKDTLEGLGGNDVIEGRAAQDTLLGGAGNDTMKGEGGSDLLDGGADNDRIFGGTGSDTAYGGTGSDVIWGSSSDSAVAEDGGNDDLSGNGGNDTIFGGKDPAAAGFDPLAQDGNDNLNGGLGDDMLYGGTGDDALNGSANNDLLDGGAGEDTAIFARAVPHTVRLGIVGPQDTGEGVDTLVGIENLIMSGGNDQISGDVFANDLMARGGNDFVFGDGAAAIYYGANIAGQVYRLYQATLDRMPDFTGHANWSGRIASGERTLLEVAQGFVASPQFKLQYADAAIPENATPAQIAQANETFVTLLYRNVLNRDPDDQGLARWTGDLDGGASRAQVVLGFSQSPQFVTDTTAEANGYASVSVSTNWSDEVYRLYQATLDRTPDVTGQTNWTGRLANGERTLLQVAEGFVNSPQFKTQYAEAAVPQNATDEQIAEANVKFVTLLYRNVLNRDPDDRGLARWTGDLENGDSRAQVVLGFSQSPQFATSTTEDVKTWMRDQQEHDRIDAGAGTNLVAGGQFADVFVFNADQDGSTTVADLEAWDWIELNGFEYGAVAEARAQMTQQGGNLVFADDGVQIIFRGTTLAEVTDDMILI